MNKFYKLVIALLPIGLMAQPTIDDSWQPAVGDSYNMTMVDGTFNFPTAGANQTWDYSNISLGTNSTVEFVDPATTPYAADFPNSNVALYDMAAGAYIYYETTTTEFLDWGLSTSQSNVIYSDPLTYITFPITYGDNSSDNASGTIASGMGTRSTTGTIEGYGYGQLILPNITLNDILCVKFVQDITDDYGGGNTSNSSTESYIFISSNESYIIFSLNEVTQPGQTVKYGMSKANYVGLNDEANAGDIKTSVFPNPVNRGDDFNISIELKETKSIDIQIIDVAGKTVNTIGSQSLSAGTNNIAIESNGLESGIYFVNINTNNGEHSSTVKMIVQ
ncbi:MAG: T9SS type A sorting domain-containing protein [Brumimicrobium sp.]